MASDLVKRRVLPRAGRHSFAQCAGGHIGEIIEGSIEGVWKCGVCENVNLSQNTHATQFVPFWHEHLGHNPVYVNSWKSYRSILRANGWHNDLAD